MTYQLSSGLLELEISSIGAELISVKKQGKERLWQNENGGWSGHAPVLFPKSVYDSLLCLPEGKGGGAVIKKYPELLRRISVADPLELMDADTPEQLAILRGRSGWTR